MGPVLQSLILCITDPLTYKFADVFDAFPFLILIGAIVIIPSAIITYFIVEIVAREKEEKFIKTLLTLLSPFLIILPLTILNFHASTISNYWPSILPVFLAYTIVLITSIWIYKIKGQS